MSAKLFVGSLPYSMNDSELSELFAAAGTVESAKIIMDRDSGRSKGFGFVEFATDEEAQSAIKMFHGKEQGGRPMTVNVAKPMTDRGPRPEVRQSRYSVVQNKKPLQFAAVFWFEHILVRLEGVEPPTPGTGNQCSIR
jgi:cold-inducible RNA-binding protein